MLGDDAVSTRHRWLAALLVSLLAVFQLQAPASSLNIFWRWAVLSYDNPATQVLDEFAAEADAPVPPLGPVDMPRAARKRAGPPRNDLFAPPPILVVADSRSPPSPGISLTP